MSENNNIETLEINLSPNAFIGPGIFDFMHSAWLDQPAWVVNLLSQYMISDKPLPLWVLVSIAAGEFSIKGNTATFRRTGTAPLTVHEQQQQRAAKTWCDDDEEEED